MPQLDFRDHIRRLPHLTTVSFANLVIEVGYVFLVCFLTFRYGGTQVDAISVLEFVTACIFLGFIVRSYLTHTWQVVNTKIWLFLGLFFAYIALLVTPLPSGLIKYLSPNARLVCDSFLPQGGLWVMRSGMRSLAVYSYAAIFELRLLCSYGILFYVAVNFFTNWHTIRRLFKVMLSLAFIIALFGISQGYHPTGKIYWFQDWSQAGNFFGPYINKNHFAGHMLLVIPYFLVMVIFAKMLEQRILAAFTAVMVIIALCMSLSRGGIISSVFMIAIFFAFLGAKNIRSKKIWVLGSVFCVALFFLGYIGMGPIRGRFLKFFIPLEVAITRGYLWRDTIALIKDFAFFGVGPGNFAYAAPLYKRFFSDSFYTHVENEYLQLAAETGIIGTILTVIIFAVFFNRMLRLYRVRRHTTVKAYLAAGLVSMIGFLFHSISNFNFHMPSLMMHFVIIAALTHNVAFIKFHTHLSEVGLSHEEDPHKFFKGGLFLTGPYKATYHYPIRHFAPDKKTERLMVYAGVVAGFLLLYGACGQFRSYAHLQKSLKSVVKSNFYLKTASGHINAIAHLKKAIALEPRNAALYYRLGILFTDIANDTYLRASCANVKELFPKKAATQKDILAYADAYYEESMFLCPLVALYHLNDAWVRDMRGDTSSAAREFARVLLLDATNMHIKRYLAEYYMRRHDYLLSFYFFGQAIFVRPGQVWETMRIVETYNDPAFYATPRAIELPLTLHPAPQGAAYFYRAPLTTLNFYYGVRLTLPKDELPVAEKRCFAVFDLQGTQKKIPCVLTETETGVTADIPDARTHAEKNFPGVTAQDVHFLGFMIQGWALGPDASVVYYMSIDIPSSKKPDLYDAQGFLGPWQEGLSVKDSEELLSR